MVSTHHLVIFLTGFSTVASHDRIWHSAVIVMSEFSESGEVLISCVIRAKWVQTTVYLLPINHGKYARFLFENRNLFT